MRVSTIVSIFCQLLSATACLTEEELRGVHSHHPQTGRLYARQRGPPTNRTDAGTIPIAVGDRFKNGTVAPRGIGSQRSANFSTIYNVAEIQSGTRALVREFGLEYFETPYKTHEGATMYGFKVAANGSSVAGHKVLLEAGIHARERGGPDHLLNFLADLLWAGREGSGLVYGGVTYSAAEVRTALSVGIVVLPLVNPDGVAYDHATNACWRKNRNPASARPNSTASVGIDLNRNFEAGWNFTKSMAPTFLNWTVSDNPATEVYHGTAPLSEPEAKNIDWTMGQMPGLRWFLDLHSYSGLMLYGWGHDTNQVKDASMNLLNPAFDGKRGIIPDDIDRGYVYGEYYERDQYEMAILTASNVVDSMTASTGRTFTAQMSVALYPATGAASDQAKYRTLQDPAKWANGFTLEFGTSNNNAKCEFYPTERMHRLSMMETGAAFMEFLLAAARFS